jgi:hypothetical protein
MAQDDDPFIIANPVFLSAALDQFTQAFGGDRRRRFAYDRLKHAVTSGALAFKGRDKHGNVHTAPPAGDSLADARINADRNVIAFGDVDTRALASRLPGYQGPPITPTEPRVVLYDVVVWTPGAVRAPSKQDEAPTNPAQPAEISDRVRAVVAILDNPANKNLLAMRQPQMREAVNKLLPPPGVSLRTLQTAIAFRRARDNPKT